MVGRHQGVLPLWSWLSRSRETAPSSASGGKGLASTSPGTSGSVKPDTNRMAWAYIHQPVNARKYSDEEVGTIKIRIRRAAEARKVALPDPDEFVDLTARVRKKRK